ncbi:hypothetical protein [Loigolactobacillus zhaoyuanensis]|uniref:HTH merR-type domain-containing protein n=1 Tax=Loigolactobacillus zhaoyuanensis TaxID=2486017 RepID=A0ABW8UG28_9LACO|nr:hypothetical protein [Loigolactobacillus zhaoyuanensis]
MKNVSGQEYQTPRQAADTLDISPQTLRAYSGLVEKTTGRTDYFQRDQNNGRLYSAQNITDLAQVNQIKKEHSKTLKDAISEVFEQQIIKSAEAADSTAATLPTAAATSATPQVSDDSLAPILYTLKQLTDQNAQVVTQIQQLKEQLDETNHNYEHLVKAIEVRNTSMDVASQAAATSSAAVVSSAASATSNTTSQAAKPNSASSLSMASSSAITVPKKSFWSRLFNHD